MDKIVDHLFILEVMEWSKIFGNILILEPMKTVQRLHKEENKAERKTGNKTTRLEINFQRAARISK
jgi:hypothetical protein